GGHAACCGPSGDANMAPEAAARCAPESSAGGTANLDDIASFRVAGEVESSACCSPAQPSSPANAESAAEPAFHDTMDALLDTFDVNEFAASVKIFALKPHG
ncbi:MAG: hypothetical protein AAFP86_07165, partial [Planctomycetota bacterium]